MTDSKTSEKETIRDLVGRQKKQLNFKSNAIINDQAGELGSLDGVNARLTYELKQVKEVNGDCLEEIHKLKQ